MNRTEITQNLCSATRYVQQALALLTRDDATDGTAAQAEWALEAAGKLIALTQTR